MPLRPEQEYSEYTNQYINWNGLLEELKACINAVGGTSVVNSSQYEDSWRGVQLALSQLRSQLITYSNQVNTNIGLAQALLSQKGQALGIASLDINKKLPIEQLPDITYGKLLPERIFPQWTNITLVNGWTFFGAPYATPQYVRIGNIVSIKGLITKLGGAPSVGELIANIPVTCADTETRVYTSFGFSASNAVVSNFFMGLDGSISYGTGNYVGGANSYFVLETTFAVKTKFATFFGDSITFGSGASSNANRWSTKLAIALGFTEDNQGIGATVLQNSAPVLANNGQDTFTTRILQRYPSRVYILYGLNDSRYNGVNFSVANFKAALTQVVQNCLNLGGLGVRDIYIGSPPYTSPAFYGSYAPFNAGSTEKHLAYRDATREVSTAFGIQWVDIYQGMKDAGGDALMSADGVHPNDAGHQVIANLFAALK